MLRLLILLVAAIIAVLGLVVGVVIAFGVAWIAVALPVVLLLGLAAGLVAVGRRLWPRRSGIPARSLPFQNFGVEGRVSYPPAAVDFR